MGLRSKRLFALACCLWVRSINNELPAQAVYSESFDTGPEKWTMGKNKATAEGKETWHRNILGHYGAGFPLKWSQAGGRSGGFAYSESPWYFDDNHGEFMWFHLIANRSYVSDNTQVAGKDLRNAVVKFSLRGRQLKLKEERFFFWIEGPSGKSIPVKGNVYEAEVYRCWALTSRPLEDRLLDGVWHDVSLTLVDDERQWSFMGLINGGLRKRIRVIQSLTSADGTLGSTLGSGKLYVWGFILAGLDPLDQPSGKIDIDEFSVTLPNH
jgi:hypothetical protein